MSYERKCNYRELVGSIACMVPVVLLHGGYFPIMLVYLLEGARNLTRSEKLSRKRMWLIYGLGSVACIALFVSLDPKQIVIKALTTDPAVLFGARPVSMSAGSAYLVELGDCSWLDVVLHAPLRLLYFFASPLPRDWRGIVDAAVFVVDSSVHILCFVVLCAYLIIMIRRKRQDVSDVTARVAMVVFWAIVLCGLLFAAATGNAGTAIRHRDVLCPLEAVGIAVGIEGVSTFRRDETG